MARDRLDSVDAVRAGAVVAMVVYHAAWFGRDAGLWAPDLGAWGWVLFQRSIAGTFFLLAGVGLRLAHGEGVRWRSLLRRELQLVVCAGVVTATSAVLDPGRVTWFGILHAMALGSLLALPWVRRPVAAGVLGALLVALGAWGPTWTARPGWGFLGLGPHAPAFDHQPLVPWLGVVLAGVAWAAWRPPGSTRRWPAWWLWLGRHSLFVYMAHVPVLVAGAWVAVKLLGRS